MELGGGILSALVGELSTQSVNGLPRRATFDFTVDTLQAIPRADFLVSWVSTLGPSKIACRMDEL
jgi:hypothetical protein